MAARTVTLGAAVPTGSSYALAGPIGDGDVVTFKVTAHVPALFGGNAAHVGAALVGTTLSGNAYIWVVDTGDISSVTFLLDGKQFHVEGGAPYDFAGTAPPAYQNGQPWDTTKVADGSHVIAAQVLYVDGSRVAASATVAIKNVISPPPPTPKLKVTAGDGYADLSWQ